MGEAGGARGVWGYVQGGMGGLADALAEACRDLGVEIRRESPVSAINTDGARRRRRRARQTARSSSAQGRRLAASMRT